MSRIIKILYRFSPILLVFITSISNSFAFQDISSPQERNEYLPPLSLTGVIVSKDASPSLAIFRDGRTGRIKMLKVGERIYGMKLTSVFGNKVILAKNGKTYQIFMGRGDVIRPVEIINNVPSKNIVAGQEKEIIENSELNTNLIKKEFIRSEVEKRIEKDWPMIIKEARFIPNLTRGKINGFKITNLPKGTILSEIGILRNDVIREINGIELDDIEKLLGLYNKFKNGNRFEVSLERGGEIIRILYILK